jgi:GT2 family glycosyltransferase
MDDVAGANMSYEAAIFERCGRFIEGTYCSDSEFHWRLADHGHRVRFRPEILISHHFDHGFASFIRHEFHHGRSFARVRVTARGFSRWRRIAYAMSWLPIAAKIAAVIAVRNLSNRTYFRRFLLSSPLWIAGVVAWSAGECAGYLGGRSR